MKINKKGVTLIELIVVFVIIAIGAVLTVPSIGPWMANYRLRSATRDIVSSLRTAQMRAVSNNVDYQVSFAGNTYILRRDSLGIPVNEGATQTLPTGITIINNTFPGNIAIFRPNSSATAGSIVLKNIKETTRTITVLLSTGRISIQ
jgi:prepilin-type N-terminal cleavage/methylation domain-containing protein